MNAFLMNGLESRTLLSGVHASVGKLEVNLDTDRAAVVADIAKLKTDVAAARANVTAALATQKEHASAAAAKMKTLTAELTKDTAAAKSVSMNGETDLKALRAKWSAVIGPEEADVKLNAEGESADERAADLAKLTADRAAAQAELMTLQTAAHSASESVTKELASDRDDIETLKKLTAGQVATDAKSIAAAVKTLQTVYQSDKLIVDMAVSILKSHGGKLDGLPVLPKL